MRRAEEQKRRAKGSEVRRKIKKNVVWFQKRPGGVELVVSSNLREKLKPSLSGQTIKLNKSGDEC